MRGKLQESMPNRLSVNLLHRWTKEPRVSSSFPDSLLTFNFYTQVSISSKSFGRSVGRDDEYQSSLQLFDLCIKMVPLFVSIASSFIFFLHIYLGLNISFNLFAYNEISHPLRHRIHRCLNRRTYRA